MDETNIQYLVSDSTRIDPLQDLMFNDYIKTWSPMVTNHHWDLIETYATYEFRCDLPGVQLEYINIIIKDDMLQVTGLIFLAIYIIGIITFLVSSMLSADRELTSNDQHLISGGRANKMTRWMKIPSNASQANPKAKYQNGVMTMTFSKLMADAAPKKFF